MIDPRLNLPLLTDSYKLGHWRMLPPGTQVVSSYLESRHGASYPYTTFFGLQALLKRYMVGPVVSSSDLKEAEDFCNEHFMQKGFFNRKMWEKIVYKYDGFLPLRIRAVPEGTAVPNSVMSMNVQNTDHDCAALTNVMETLLTHLWFMSNVATISRDIRSTFEGAFEQSVDPDSQFLLDYMLHDFGFRGTSSLESAEMGGMAHLVNFKGTDTIPAIQAARRYYPGAEMAGYSVAATEHSVMTAEGEDGELEVFRRILKEFPTGVLSVVGDSYSIKRFVEVYMPACKKEILAREGKTVVRPDSPRHQGDLPEEQIEWIAGSLAKSFGETTNKKGYKVLEPHVGIIYGDGLTAFQIKQCIRHTMNRGWAATLSVYGMGGGLLQKHNRDTQRNAFKCSAQRRNEQWYDVCKTPLDKSKASKKGLLKTVREFGSHGSALVTVPRSDPRVDVLEPVFFDGVLQRDQSWSDVRENAKRSAC